MYVLNLIDEQGRLKEVQYIFGRKAGQGDSHGYSYLGARKEYKKLGDEMGFDKLQRNLSALERMLSKCK